jgi:hypothetical protein
MKSESSKKRTKSHGPVPRETKQVMAELVRKLRGKLDAKAESGRTRKERGQGGLRPNLEGLTGGVDLGDQWSSYCILGWEGETLSEGQLRPRQQDFTEFFQALTRNGWSSKWGRIPPGCRK